MSVRLHSGELNEIIVTVLADTVTHSVWKKRWLPRKKANLTSNIKSKYSTVISTTTVKADVCKHVAQLNHFYFLCLDFDVCGVINQDFYMLCGLNMFGGKNVGDTNLSIAERRYEAGELRLCKDRGTRMSVCVRVCVCKRTQMCHQEGKKNLATCQWSDHEYQHNLQSFCCFSCKHEL